MAPVEWREYAHLQDWIYAHLIFGLAAGFLDCWMKYPASHPQGATLYFVRTAAGALFCLTCASLQRRNSETSCLQDFPWSSRNTKTSYAMYIAESPSTSRFYTWFNTPAHTDDTSHFIRAWMWDVGRLLLPVEAG